MKPVLSMAAVAAAVTALAVAPALSQVQPQNPRASVKAHKKSHIRPRSGQRPADWRAAPDQAASASSSAQSSAAESSAEASGASNSPTPYPPTLRPANFYARDANGTGGKTAYPDPNVDRGPGVTPLPEQPLCVPRTGATATQPNCPLPATRSPSPSGTSTRGADSHAPDR
jgi:hypothetical protein